MLCYFGALFSTIYVWKMWILIVLLLHLSGLDGDINTLSFPELENLAYGRPVSTVPWQASCGEPTPSAFCASSGDSSETECLLLPCVQLCPHRSSLSASQSLISPDLLPNCAVFSQGHFPAYTDPVLVLESEEVISECSFSGPHLSTSPLLTIAVWLMLEKLDTER